LALSLVVVSSVFATSLYCPTVTVSQVKNNGTNGIVTGQFGTSNCVTVVGQLMVAQNPATPSTMSSINDSTGTIDLNNVDIPISLNGQTVTLIGQLSANPPAQLFALQIKSRGGQLLFQEQTLTIVTTSQKPTIRVGPQGTSASATDAIILAGGAVIVGYLIARKRYVSRLVT
jgi:hypothetical protein